MVSANVLQKATPFLDCKHCVFGQVTWPHLPTFATLLSGKPTVRLCADALCKFKAHQALNAEQVIEGYNVVKAIEACGSSSGSTSHDVIIRDCGEGRGPVQPATASAQASGACSKFTVHRVSDVHKSHS